MLKKIILITLIAFISSCDLIKQDDYREYVVVESYMVSDRQLPPIFISRTVPASTEYLFENAALNSAVVLVHLLDETGEIREQSFTFNVGNPGEYSTTENHLVIPGRRYELEISFPDRVEMIRARTRIPDRFTVEELSADSLVYQSPNQLEITLSNSNTSSQQSVFVFNTLAQDIRYENLTPFYKNFVDDEFITLEQAANSPSGLLNEANFEANNDGSITIRYPWIGVAFFGPNLLVANSLDSNLNDLIRSQEVQLGGSTLSPGEIPNAIYNIEGGIGVFGSISSDTVSVYFERP
jgi:hypothetical protein